MAESPPYDFLRRIFEEAWRYVDQLVEENSRLEARANQKDESFVDMTAENVRLREELRLALQESAREKTKREDLGRELDRVAVENEEFANNCVSLERRVSSLSALYAASHELHVRLDVAYVLSRLQEIVLDLLGSESFAIYLADEPRRLLSPAVMLDVPEAATRPVTLGIGEVGKAAIDPRAWVEIETREAGSPVVVVPLRVQDELVGVLAIFQFLPQKRSGVTDLDRELFQLLSGQAATALQGAMLFAKEARRAATLTGLVELVRSTRPHS